MCAGVGVCELGFQDSRASKLGSMKGVLLCAYRRELQAFWLMTGSVVGVRQRWAVTMKSGESPCLHHGWGSTAHLSPESAPEPGMEGHLRLRGQPSKGRFCLPMPVDLLREEPVP